MIDGAKPSTVTQIRHHVFSCAAEGTDPFMPTLLDYLRVSQIQNESPTLPYGSPNLPDTKEMLKKQVVTLSLVNFGRKF